MRNEKGFTLMELLAAIFIGGMVTAAIVLIWKTASVQTNQGQRQTIIRNQISSFQRQLYRDFHAADIVVSPYKSSSTSGGVLLSGLKKAKRVSATQYEPFPMGSSAEGPTKVFLYCLHSDNIKRYEQIVTRSADNPIEILYTTDAETSSPIPANLSDDCISKGKIILRNVNSVSVERGPTNTLASGVVSFKAVILRTFGDMQETTPIRVEINETLLESGGI